MAEAQRTDRAWWRRRSLLNIRNSRLVMLAGVSLLMGIAAMLLTAYLGVR